MRIQSHICEQRPEVEYTLKLFPDHEHCASIFEKSGLLTDKVLNLTLVSFYETKEDLVLTSLLFDKVNYSLHGSRVKRAHIDKFNEKKIHECAYI